MPTSNGNPAVLNAIDTSKAAGAMPASGQPLTTFNGLRTNMPIQKAYMSGAVRRDIGDVYFGNGLALTASTSYPQWIVIPRAALITGLWLVLGTAPTVANSLLTVTSNGVSLLAGANFTITSATPVNQVINIPLSTVLAVSPAPVGLPYLPLAPAQSFPYPVLCTYAEGATTVHSTNVGLFIEYELDDFNG